MPTNRNQISQPDYLAAERRVAASTQNQALCALLFLYREVIGRELGEFAGLQRARRSRHGPTVLSRVEAGWKGKSLPLRPGVIAWLQLCNAAFGESAGFGDPTTSQIFPP